MDTIDSTKIPYIKMQYHKSLDTLRNAIISSGTKTSAHQCTLPRGLANRAENSLQTKSYHATPKRHYALRRSTKTAQVPNKLAP